MLFVLSLVPALKQQFNELINGKSQTNGLIKQILMVGFSGILDTVQVQDRKMMKDKLIDGKEL